jgi:hypothetical protein
MPRLLRDILCFMQTKAAAGLCLQAHKTPATSQNDAAGFFLCLKFASENYE